MSGATGATTAAVSRGRGRVWGLRGGGDTVPFQGGLFGGDDAARLVRSGHCVHGAQEEAALVLLFLGNGFDRGWLG